MTQSATVSGTALAGKGGSKKSNTGAIVGGVVGGVLGAALLAALLGFLLWKRKKAKAVAFDDKMFDPDLQTRHSAHDNLDFIAPTAGAGAAATSLGHDETYVDPYPYEQPPQPPHDGYGGAYDPYAAHAQQSDMAMPDARDYQPGYHTGYDDYGYANDGTYAGVGAAGAVAAYGGGTEQHYSEDQYAGQPLSPEAAAKAHEAQGERALSPTAASSQQHGSAYGDALSNQDHQVYHESAYHESAPHEGMSEIPPK